MKKRIAMWRLHDKNDAAEMKEKLLSLKNNVPSIVDLEVGINESQSESAFDIVFIATFNSEQCLRDFENDAYHKVIGAWVNEKRLLRHVVDYEFGP